MDMLYRIKKRKLLGIVLILLVLLTMGMEKMRYDRAWREGDCMESLCFTIKNSMSEQVIRCFQDEAQEICYLFLPSYANAGDVHISFTGAYEVVFAGAQEEVRQMYRFPDLFTDYQKRMLEEIAGKQSVSVHIRRGDYLNHPEIYGTTTLDYYRNAMTYMQDRRENIHFYIFTNDIPWAEQNFEGDNITIVEDSGDLMTGNLDMALMAECKDNIIANSSFSWWAAWLNRNEQKIVIAPKAWEVNQSTKDIWCENWIKM